LKLPRFIFLAVLAGMLASGLRAQVTTIFTSAGFTGVDPTITFNSLTNETAITNQFSSQGVTFSGGLFALTNSADLAYFTSPGGVIASDWKYSLGSPTLPWNASFTTPQAQVGWLTELWNGDTITVTAKLNSTVIGTATYTHTGTSLNSFFFGIKATGGFDSISVNITGPNNHFIAIDDFRFQAIPEPGVTALLASGLGLTALLGFRRRRA
jgi:hypothetical protein